MSNPAQPEGPIDPLEEATEAASLEGPDEHRAALKTLARGATLRAVSRGAGLILGVLSSIFLVRSLGVSGFGALTFALSIVTFTGTAADLGVRIGVTRMASLDPADDTRWGRAGLRITVAAGLLGTIGISLLAFTATPTVPTVFLVLAPMVLASAVSSSVVGFLTARRRIGIVEGATLIQQVLHHGGAIALAAAGAATVLRVAGTAVVPYVLMMIALLLVWRRETTKAASRGETPVRKLLAFSLPVLLQTLAFQALLRSDVIMLGLFAGAGAVGLYAPALRLTDLTWVAFSTIGSYYVPVATRIVAGGDLRKLQHLFITLTKWETALVAPLLAALIITPVPILTFLFGEAFERAGGIVRILALGYAIHEISGHNCPTLVALGRSRAVAIRSSVALVGNLALNAALIPALGPVGAALGTAIAFLALNAANSYLIYRAARIHIFTREIGIVLGCAVLAAILSGLVAHRLGLSETLLGPFLVGASVALFGVGAAMLTGRPPGGQIFGRLLSSRP